MTRTPPNAAVCPPVRCYWRVEDGDVQGEPGAGGGAARAALTRHGPSLPVCGRPARWLRKGLNWFADGFFCDEHRGPTDVALAGPVSVRRVRVTAELVLTATSLDQTPAHIEAVARLQAAVEGVGGLMDFVRVTSAHVHYADATPPSASNRAPSDAEWHPMRH